MPDQPFPGQPPDEFEKLPSIPDYVPYSNDKASKWAAEEIKEKEQQTEQRNDILKMLERVGAYGATYHEVSRELNMDRSSAGSNISVLYTHYFVHESGEYRKDPITKKKCRTVVLPQYDPENKGRHPGYERRQLDKEKIDMLAEIQRRTRSNSDSDILGLGLKLILYHLNVKRDERRKAKDDEERRKEGYL